jgi:alkylhydroperoxidase family enzyme
MARVPYLDKSDLAPENEDLLARNITLHRALAHSPNGLRAFGGLGQFIRHRSRLDPRLRELAILQVGYLARAPYEWSHHVKIGREFGVTDEDIRALIAETEERPSQLEPIAKHVLKAAREMTNDLAITQATFAALAAHLDNEHLVDLVITISFYNAVVRLLASLAIDVEPEYQKYLEAFPACWCRGAGLMSDAGKSIAVARPAATVVILRDGRQGLEVFMVVRHHEIDFASGALVFPGG